jgi:Family of unknown function (DUF6982)
MSTPATPAGSANKVVVAFLDGRRVKGYILNFSPLREAFRLFPEGSAVQSAGTDCRLKDLKAIFFVKDFTGNPERRESNDLAQGARGRKLEITFSDGEKLAGTTEAYSPQKLGFFIFPADLQSNNSRIFIVNANVREVKQL